MNDAELEQRVWQRIGGTDVRAEPGLSQVLLLAQEAAAACRRMAMDSAGEARQQLLGVYRRMTENVQVLRGMAALMGEQIPAGLPAQFPREPGALPRAYRRSVQLQEYYGNLHCPGIAPGVLQRMAEGECDTQRILLGLMGLAPSGRTGGLPRPVCELISQ